MDRSARGADYLQVLPPSSMGKRERRTRLADRLARNLSPLFGVPVPDGPLPTIWAGDYRRVQVAEIGRGAPRGIDHPDLDVIATALLHRFGPDTKPALVLTGLDRLLSSLEPTLRTVQDTVSVCEDGLPLATCSQLLVWASLVSDIYLAQPDVFVAAVTARATQRATTLSWRPVGGVTGSASLEYVEAATAPDPAFHPRTLGVLDGAIRRIVGGDELLADMLVDRWTRRLLESHDCGLAWVSKASTGQTVGAYSPRLPLLGAFAAEVLDHVARFSLYDPADPDGEPFDEGNEAHVHRVVPRVPAIAEFAALDPRAQRAMAKTLSAVYRVLRDSERFNSELTRNLCQDRLEKLASTCVRVLGDDDAVTVHVDLIACRAQLAALRNRRADEESSVALAHMMRRQSQLRAAWRDGSIGQGEWVEAVEDNSITFNDAWQDLRVAGRSAESDRVRTALQQDWDSAFDLLGLSSEPSVEDLEALPPTLSHLVHSWCGYRLWLPQVDLRAHALDLGKRIVIPQRRAAVGAVRGERAFRNSLQVCLRAAALMIDDLDDAGQRADLLGDIYTWYAELSRTAMAQRLATTSSHSFSVAELNLLAALAPAAVVLASDQRESVAQARRMVDLLTAAFLSRSGSASLNEVNQLSRRALLVHELVMQVQARFDELVVLPEFSQL